MHFRTVIDLENPKNFPPAAGYSLYETVINIETPKKIPPAAGYFLQILFSPMTEASSCRCEMVQKRARTFNISFSAMIDARSCIGEIV